MILRWHRNNRRSFPWRSTRDPYTVFVSEVMLQQTQAARVLLKLPEFLACFPTLGALARASTADVIRAWRGMGYNNRAVRLRNAARTILNRYDGTIPRNPDQLSTLPGIGRYTAAAIACFAYGSRISVVDVNIRRVLSRMHRRMSSISALRNEAEIHILAASLLPRNARSWNEALMDLGATVCTARRVHCTDCPAVTVCRSRHLSAPHPRRHHTGASKRREEPTYRGTPQRVWRGRMIEHLRRVNGRESLLLPDLGIHVMPDFRREDLRWLEGLARNLERDGLVQLRRRKGLVRISLVNDR